MENERMTPTALVHLVKSHIWEWVIDSCPYCGKTHRHGGGKLDEDPFQLLGHRAAHCQSRTESEAGYILQVVRIPGKVAGKVKKVQG